MNDEELQFPLIEGSSTSQHRHAFAWNIFGRRRMGVLLTLISSFFVFLATFDYCDFRHKKHHGHVMYQAILRPNQQIDYTREFTAPCDYGILVFNIGPAANYLPYKYDIYQDAYVFSNNKKMCWAYPTYRGIQTGPFPWWIQGDPTSFDVPTGRIPTKISNRIVRPMGSKNITATKGGDFLIIARGKFYTPAFYKNLKATINSWTDNHDDSVADLEKDFGSLLDNLTMVNMKAWEAGELEIVP